MAFELEKHELLQLAEEHDGLLTVDAVLAAAEDDDSPLHRHFTWDDTAAAQQYRRWQARVLIAKCRVVVEDRTDTEVRAFISVPSDRHAAGGGYRLTVDVQSDTDRKSELMREIAGRVRYWQRQSALLDMPVRQALDAFAVHVGQASAQAEQPVAA